MAVDYPLMQEGVDFLGEYMDKRIVQGKNIYLRNIKIEDIKKGWLECINGTNTNRYLSTKAPSLREFDSIFRRFKAPIRICLQYV